MTDEAANERQDQPTPELDERQKRERLRRLLTDRLIEAVQDPKVKASMLATATRFLSECGSIDTSLPPASFNPRSIQTVHGDISIDDLPSFPDQIGAHEQPFVSSTDEEE